MERERGCARRRTAIATNRHDAILGALLAGAIGDALGAPFEGARAGAPAPPLGLGDPTDDTQLTCATCEAIARAGGKVDPERIAARMLAWWRRGDVTGLGGATLGALRGLAAGGHWALVGRRGEHAAGNGAAMRIAPVALALDAHDPLDRVRARDVCRVTHHSDEAWAGALAMWLALDASLAGALADPSYLPGVVSGLPDSRTRDVLSGLVDAPAQDVATLTARTGTGGYTPESVPLAIAAAPWAAADFEGTLATLVAQGGDADTIASLCGQIAGATLGVGGLPRRWVEGLPGWVGQACRVYVEVW